MFNKTEIINWWNENKQFIMNCIIEATFVGTAAYVGTKMGAKSADSTVNIETLNYTNEIKG